MIASDLRFLEPLERARRALGSMGRRWLAGIARRTPSRASLVIMARTRQYD